MQTQVQENREEKEILQVLLEADLGFQAKKTVPDLMLLIFDNSKGGSRTDRSK